MRPQAWFGIGTALALAAALLAAGCGGGGGGGGTSSGGGSSSGGAADITAPAITSAATNLATVGFFGGNVTLSARVSDAGSVAAVWADITRTGSTPVRVNLALATAPTYQATWPAPSNAGGQSSVVYTVRVSARDAANNTATSGPLTVTVEAPDAPPPAPNF